MGSQWQNCKLGKGFRQELRTQNLLPLLPCSHRAVSPTLPSQQRSSAFRLALGCISPRYIYEQIQKYEKERTANQSTYWYVLARSAWLVSSVKETGISRTGESDLLTFFLISVCFSCACCLVPLGCVAVLFRYGFIGLSLTSRGLRHFISKDYSCSLSLLLLGSCGS